LLQSINEKFSAGKLFVPSLTVAYFSTWIIEALTGIFLIDITLTFFGSSDPVSIATASQLVTISAVVSVIFGFLLGALSVRFSHKKLLLLGVLSVTLGTLGCFLAPNFLFMQIFYPVEGIGTVAVSAMAFALVGEFLILSKRGKATGWIIAGSSMAGIVASLVISFFFSGAGSWRSYLLWFALPISLIALAAAHFGVPSSPRKPKNVGKEAYLSSFKQVFLKKSAAGCLIGNMIRQAGLAWAIVYSATFFRIQFDLSLASAALIGLGATALFVLGSIAGGQLVNRVGRKRLLITTLVVSAPALALIAFVPNSWIALAINFSGAFIYSMGFAGSVNLTLEQAPESRGTMMSISTIFITLGLGIGAALGGAALAFFKNYTSLILTFAAIQLTAAAIYFFLTKDPCKTKETT
jgi:predicted MFS family arabinose efflux permease